MSRKRSGWDAGPTGAQAVVINEEKLLAAEHEGTIDLASVTRCLTVKVSGTIFDALVAQEYLH